MSAKNGKNIRVGRRVIGVSNWSKIFFPEKGYTKGDLAEYYRDVSAAMLPHVRGRPVTMLRAPDGYGPKKEKFYQQDMPDYFPSWIGGVTVKKEGGSVRHVLVGSAAALVYLAGQGCVTPHTWLSRVGSLDRPDQMVFDLDPPEGDFESVRWTALKLKGLFDDIGVTVYAMTTGSEGVHVVVPLRPESSFDRVRGIARDIADKLAALHPDRLTTEQRKNRRKGRVFLDYLRNARGQTTVAPYAVRLREGAPVAAPLGWDELKDRSVDAQKYDIKAMSRRISRKEDPWKDFGRHRVKPETLKTIIENKK